jgi:molybdate transport system substrate-binding protein
MSRLMSAALCAAVLAAGLMIQEVGAAEAAAAREKTAASGALLVHVGGTMRPAMDEICKLFQQETGVKVEMNYNDSGAIMTVIETTGKGDLCIVHDPFPAAMEKKGMVDRR